MAATAASLVIRFGIGEPIFFPDADVVFVVGVECEDDRVVGIHAGFDEKSDIWIPPDGCFTDVLPRLHGVET